MEGKQYVTRKRFYFRVRVSLRSTYDYNDENKNIHILSENTTPWYTIPFNFFSWSGPLHLSEVAIGPILDDRLNEQFLKP